MPLAISEEDFSSYSFFYFIVNSINYHGNCTTLVLCMPRKLLQKPHHGTQAVVKRLEVAMGPSLQLEALFGLQINYLAFC